MMLRELKESMLYQACEYEKTSVDMQRFIDINEKPQVQPEADILTFYLGAHVMGLIEQKYGLDQELPEDVMQLAQYHHSGMEDVFMRIFTYVLLISVGESRHASTHHHNADIVNKFGQNVAHFGSCIYGKGRSGARHEFLQSDRNLHTYAEYLDWMFVNCFSGGSFGGKKWQNISTKITQVLYGEISPFTMTDISWALVHNTGSIFNKNTIYYKEKNSSGLTQLLDMQRGGAIPALITHYQKYANLLPLHINGSLITQTLKDDVAWAGEVLGEPIDEFVEPKVIHEAGALTSSFNLTPTDNDEKSVAKTNLTYSGDTLQIGMDKFAVLERSN